MLPANVNAKRHYSAGSICNEFTVEHFLVLRHLALFDTFTVQERMIITVCHLP